MDNNQGNPEANIGAIPPDQVDVPFDGSLAAQQRQSPQGQPQPQYQQQDQVQTQAQPQVQSQGQPPMQQAQIQMQQQAQGQMPTHPQGQSQQAQTSAPSAPQASNQEGHGGTGAAHAKKAQSAFIQRSSKMRKLYVVIIILLVIVVVAIAFLAVRMILASDNSATQQTQISSTELTEVGEGDDASEGEERKTTVPNIVELLGKTRKQAVAEIGHGAEVVSSRKVKEEGSDIRREVRVELTDEPSDSKSGAPTVYLSLNKEGKIVHVGYSVAIASLGYGSASFSDTVESDHIVENTLGEAGLNVEPGSAVLPEDETQYKSYSSDGSVTTKEYYSFSGKGTANGKTYDWEAMLSYDYTVANASDNLDDTLRTIFVYVS